jgi:hypothetical protein
MENDIGRACSTHGRGEEYIGNFGGNTAKKETTRKTMTHCYFTMALLAHSGLRPLIPFRNHFSQISDQPIRTYNIKTDLKKAWY